MFDASTITLIGDTLVEVSKVAAAFVKIQAMNLASKADITALWDNIAAGDAAAVTNWSTAFAEAKAKAVAASGSAFIQRPVSPSPVSEPGESSSAEQSESSSVEKSEGETSSSPPAA